jgi:hypothetical protein
MSRIREIGIESIESEIKLSCPNPELETFVGEFRNNYGSFVRWTKPIAERYQIWFCVTGENLEQNISHVEQFRLFYDLICLSGLHTTRVDLAITDRLKLFKWVDVYQSSETDNYAGYQSYEQVSGKKKRGQLRDGITFYYGSRNSEKLTRIYETKAKHGYAANKIETEFKGRKAKLLGEIFALTWKDLLNKYKDSREQLAVYIDICRGYVLGSIDFIDRSYAQSCNGSIKDCPRLPWWEKFCNFVKGVKYKLTIPTPDKTLITNENWIVKQVLPSLLTRFIGLDPDEFVAWLLLRFKDAKKRLKPNQLLDIDILKSRGMEALGVWIDWIAEKDSQHDKLAMQLELKKCEFVDELNELVLT